MIALCFCRFWHAWFLSKQKHWKWTLWAGMFSRRSQHFQEHYDQACLLGSFNISKKLWFQALPPPTRSPVVWADAEGGATSSGSAQSNSLLFIFLAATLWDPRIWSKHSSFLDRARSDCHFLPGSMRGDSHTLSRAVKSAVTSCNTNSRRGNNCRLMSISNQLPCHKTDVYHSKIEFLKIYSTLRCSLFCERKEIVERMHTRTIDLDHQSWFGLHAHQGTKILSFFGKMKEARVELGVKVNSNRHL